MTDERNIVMPKHDTLRSILEWVGAILILGCVGFGPIVLGMLWPWSDQSWLVFRVSGGVVFGSFITWVLIHEHYHSNYIKRNDVIWSVDRTDPHRLWDICPVCGKEPKELTSEERDKLFRNKAAKLVHRTMYDE